MVSSWLSVSVDESGWDDFGDTVGADADLPAAILRPVAGFAQIVVMRTQQHQIRQAGGAAVLPGLDVVGVTIGRCPVAAREDASSVAGWSAIGSVSVGTSLTLVTVIVKRSETDNRPSEAVNLIAMLPTSPLAGVPENVRVAASKESQAGRVLPSSSVAA